MANKNYLDTAKQLREGVSALLARINVAQSSVTDLLAQDTAPVETALAVPIDTRYLMLGGAPNED